MTNGTV
jgi:hypothetical protein